MASVKLSKVCLSKSSSTTDFASEEYLLDYLTTLKAKSNLPISQILAMICNNQVDTISCSRDDTNYSFFASQSKKGISIVVKKIGEDIIEFTIPCNTVGKIMPLAQL